MSNLTDKLLEMKKEIEDSKMEKERLEGKLQQLLLQLKKDFDCCDIKNAKQKLESLTNEIQTLQKELEEEIKLLDI